MASTLTFTPSGLSTPLKELASCKSSFTSSPRLASLPIVSKTRVACSAAAAEPKNEGGKQLATALALAAVLSTAPLTCPQGALADVAGLTPCKDSKAFAKREEKEIKKLAKRLEKYAPDSAPALAINATIEKTKRRFDLYGSHGLLCGTDGLLCGTDGLPHLIVDSFSTQNSQRHQRAQSTAMHSRSASLISNTSLGATLALAHRHLDNNLSCRAARRTAKHQQQSGVKRDRKSTR